ncbi:PREDICTED: sodium- and chloride-dependent glycine transporter 2-like [Priapulus caudatus]|uniref:Sodium- and chloride-dependent glycine transporter 2-like n=1 Tax=Priapulus caudatus TaxID=37621 RepID=A0ABM1EDS3_PRICU|nr:PREDICTED: sodium- and chloride-dependent glycine transporter 2-like [Priapulus caudatus]
MENPAQNKKKEKGGMYVLNVIDVSIGGIALIILGIVEFLTIHWVYGTDKLCEDIALMIGKEPSLFWRICWKYISPVILIFVLIMSLVVYAPITYTFPYAEDGVYEYPSWVMVIEWSFVAIPLALIIIGFFSNFITLTALKEAAQPAWNWGPAAEQRKLHSGDISRQFFTSNSEISLSTIDTALSTDMKHGVINSSFDPTLDITIPF